MGTVRNGFRFGACILALVALVGILLSRPANAQSAGATLTGVITDKSGALVSNAKVQIKKGDRVKGGSSVLAYLGRASQPLTAVGAESAGQGVL